MLLRTGLALLSLLPLATTHAGPTPASGRLKVLFLGDRGHHQPAARCQDVLAELHGRGIQLTYSEELEALSAARLEPYDAVLLYANIDVLPPQAEEALLSYVASGRGFVPVHCASFCFRNSEPFVELVGAQFQRHGTGTFRTRFVADHPILEGLQPFESWDETYVHSRHGEERTILSVREDDTVPGGAEPWTWIRRHGDGRIFYTAWGHDQRTWRNPGFHDLLERGIRWAAGGSAALEVTEPEVFTSSDAPVPIPSYQQGGYEDQSRMQDPLDPQTSLSRLALPDGLEARLFASEPLIAEPIALTFDERGRVWIAETLDYPNERKDEGGRDRISILEDTDGDGRADGSTVFAEGLSIPTGLVHTPEGLVVVQAPHTLLLLDHDGDDRADEQRVLFSGWGTGDTHAGPSNLRLGPDGWVWGTVGYSGFRGAVGGVEHRFGQGVLRFRPDGSELEYVAPTTNNTWGLGISEEFDVFASTANGNPSVHAVIPNRYYEAVEGLAPGALRTIAETTLFHAVNPSVRQVDYHGRHTAAAGHGLYTGRLLPERYWNRVAFVAEPTGGLVARLELEPQGSSFIARDRWNLLASDDQWTSPIVAETGPCGAVWIIDWYSFVVQHNPTPPGFENGAGNAYVTPLRDQQRARIWRVVPGGSHPAPVSSLAGRSLSELVAALRSDTLERRTTAQRLLVERHDPGPRGEQLISLLLDLAEEAELDGTGNAPAALHALWTLEQLGALEDDSLSERAEDVLVRSLRSPAPGLRRAAIQLLPRNELGRDLLLSAGLLEDQDGRVVVAALLALSEMPAGAAAGRAVAELLAGPDAGEDRWIADAATCAAARHDVGFLRAVLAGAATGPEEAGEDASQPAGPPENIILNGGAEEAAGEGDAASPAGWTTRTYSGRGQHGWVEGAGRGGGRALLIESDEPTDTSWTTEVRLDPDARYRLSGWVRSEGLEGRCHGALFNVHEIQGAQNARTEAVRGDTGWTEVAVEFAAEGRDRVTINALFGGWGQATGRAWFDDVRLERLPDPPFGGALGSAFARVARHHGSRAPADTIGAVLTALVDVEPEVSNALLTGLADGWPQGSSVEVGPVEAATLQAVWSRLGTESRPSLLRLLERWDQTELLGRSSGEVLAGLRADVQGGAWPRSRVAAARQLVLLADDGQTARLLLAQLALDAEPELAGGVLDALGSSTRPELGGELLEAFDRMTPLARRQAVKLLGRRAPWTRALLESIERGELPASTIGSAGWHELGQHPDPELAAMSRRVGGGAEEKRLEGDELLLRYAHVVEQGGDSSRGKTLFDEHCMRCHLLDGRGGRVGPELDGVGQRPPLELLTAILLPSRSVETNYQLWTARTKDGRIFSGRLASETRTTIELMDTEGESSIIGRDELEVLQPSSLSLMPSGLEQQLSEQGLADLLEYMASLSAH